MEERFLTTFLPGLRFPREAMLLRALKDTGEPLIAQLSMHAHATANSKESPKAL